MQQTHVSKYENKGNVLTVRDLFIIVIIIIAGLICMPTVVIKELFLYFSQTYVEYI